MRTWIVKHLLALTKALALWARQSVPVPLLPVLVAIRFNLEWRRPSLRAKARDEMSFLLGAALPNADLDTAARAYVRRQIWRGEMRWHPEAITNLPVVGLEHLQAARAAGQGVVLNFMHHGYFEGALASIVRAGVDLTMVVYPYGLGPDAPAWIRQHLRVASSTGARVVSTEIGAQGISKLLRSGEVVAIASDVPGRTPMRFVGRDVLGSFGAARLPFEAGSAVVVMTCEEDQRGTFVRLSPPLQPEAFADPRGLLDAMLAQHERVVLRWPEATDIPTARWKPLDPSAEVS